MEKKETVLIIGTGTIKSMLDSLEENENIRKQRLEDPEPIMYKALPKFTEPFIDYAHSQIQKSKRRNGNMQSPKKHKRKKAKNGKSKKK